MGKLTAILALMTSLAFAHPAHPNQHNETVDSLIVKAAQQMDEDNLELADATLERAIRVNPERADTWHMLARLRFKQGKYEQAVSMARKSDGLPDASDTVRVNNSELISEARDQLGDGEPSNRVASGDTNQIASKAPLTIVIRKPRAPVIEKPIAQTPTWSEPDIMTTRIAPVIQEDYILRYSPPVYSGEATYWDEPRSYNDEYTGSKQQRKLLKRLRKQEERREKKLEKAQRKLAKRIMGQQSYSSIYYQRSERDVKRARAVQRLDQWMQSNGAAYRQY